MLFSIAISTYEANGIGVDFLKKNLDMIKIQTYKNIEVIVSDHSKDNRIRDLCTSYSYPKIKYFKYDKDYGNSSSNTNNALNKCNGDLIKIIFMDDYLENEYSLQLIIDQFMKYPEKNWLINSYYHKKHTKENYENIHHPTWNDCLLLFNTFGCPSAVTLRNNIKTRFDSKLIWYMDCDFYHRIILEYGFPIIYHKPIVVNSIHEDQVTNKINDKLVNKERDYLIIHRKINKNFIWKYLKFIKKI